MNLNVACAKKLGGRNVEVNWCRSGLGVMVALGSPLPRAKDGEQQELYFKIVRAAGFAWVALSPLEGNSDAVAMKNPLLTLALGAAMGLMSCASTDHGSDVLDSTDVFVVEASGGA